MRTFLPRNVLAFVTLVIWWQPLEAEDSFPPRDRDTWAMIFSTGDVLAFHFGRAGTTSFQGSAYLLVDEADFKWQRQGELIELTFTPPAYRKQVSEQKMFLHLSPSGELQLLRQGVLAHATDSEIASVRFTRTERNPYDLGRAAFGKRAKEMVPPVPSPEIPASLLTGVARVLLHASRVPEQGIAYWLNDPRLAAEFIDEAVNYAVRVPPESQPAYSFALAEPLASNRSISPTALKRLFDESAAPRVWRAAVGNPTAPTEWASIYRERVLGASPAVITAALKDPEIPADLIDRLAETGPVDVLSEVSRNSHASSFALQTVFRRSQKERGSDPYVWDNIAAHPNTPIEVLEQIADTATQHKMPQMLAALAGNPSCPPELHRKIAETLFNLVFGDGQPPYGPSPLADPFLAPFHLQELIDLPVPSVRAAIASNPSLSDEQLRKLAADPSELVSRRAIENWRKRYPAGDLSLVPSSAAKQPWSQDWAEIRELIDHGQLAQAVAAWRKLPKGLQAGLGGVTYWDPARGSPSRLLDFIAAAEPPGGPLATNMLLAFVVNAPEQVSEMAKRGLLERIAPFPALSQAINTGKAATVGLLLDAGLSPNCVGDGGVRPLTLVAEKGDVEMVKLLIQHGADKQGKDGYSRTAADHARRAFRVETFALLAETPAEREQLTQLRKLLVPAPADSPWVRRWSNRKDGFSSVTVVFERDGSFVFGSATLMARGGWHAVETDRAVATPIWFEDDMPTEQKKELAKLKAVFGEIVFQIVGKPMRMQFKLGEQYIEMFPVDAR